MSRSNRTMAMPCPVNSRSSKNLRKISLLALFFLFFILKSKAQFSCGPTCSENMTIPADWNCEAKIVPQSVGSYPLTCFQFGRFKVSIEDSKGLKVPNPIPSTYINKEVSVKITDTVSWRSCITKVVVVDKKGPMISNCKDVTVNCSSDFSPELIGKPTAMDNCSSTVVPLTYKDAKTELGCGMSGFQNYFAPANWSFLLKNNGDGAVQTNNSPQSITLIGAKNSPYTITPVYVSSYSIKAPSDGVVSFDWKIAGNTSNFSSGDALFFTINDTCVRVSDATRLSGKFSSWNVKAGDFIRFELTSDGNANFPTATISNFAFNTIYKSVIARTWSSSDAMGNISTCTQNIYVRNINSSQIIFPKNKDDVSDASLECGSSIDPKYTGFPLVDKDNDPKTIGFDTLFVNKGSCLIATYTDAEVPTCGKSKIITRNWKIIEDCHSTIIEHTQTIRIKDKTPPSIVCPKNITVATDNTGKNCSANVTLPVVTATDNCSDNVAVMPMWKYGQGQQLYTNVEAGIHIVTYSATDACGNTATCTMTVTVVDKTPPVMVCNEKLVVGLTYSGNALLEAKAIDAGSYDNCCFNKFEVKRMSDTDDKFSQSMNFYCTDLAQPVTTLLRGWDCEGNYNTCMVNITVQNKIDPVVTCPGDITITCADDRSDLSRFGKANSIGNCGNLALDYTTQDNVNKCGVGTILRRWTAKGTTVGCTQKITVELAERWNNDGSKIIWPIDYSTEVCSNQLALHPDSLPKASRRPELLGSETGCSSVLMGFEDTKLSQPPSACLVILRKWTVIDWCQYDANSGSTLGKWTFTQKISVVDKDPPVFQLLSDVVFKSQEAKCGEAYVTMPIAKATDCNPSVTIANSVNGKGADASDIYPFGVTRVLYKANDGCGNERSKYINVTVSDGKKPTPLALSVLSVNLQKMAVGTGMAVVKAKDFEQNSSDNCSPKEKLKFSFSTNPNDTTRLFSCDSIGNRVLKFWVTDEAGNQDFVNVIANVQNNMNACPATGSQQSIIDGNIKTYIGANVQNVKIDAMEGTSSVQTILTGLNGIFNLGLLKGKTYEIVPKKLDNPANGISTLDLVEMKKHILGLEPLDNAYQMIAADVNKSGTISVSDVVELRKMILGLSDSLSNNTSWRFVRKDYVFDNLDEVLTKPFPESFSTQTLSDYNKVDFIGVKIGDLNDSANPNELQKMESRNQQTLTFDLDNKSLLPNETYDIQFKAADFKDVFGFQFSVEYDTAAIEFLSAKATGLAQKNEDNFILTPLKAGVLTGSWFTLNELQIEDSATLFNVKVKAKKAISLNNALTISSAFTQAEAYKAPNEVLNVSLRFNEKDGFVENKTFEVFQNQPNPFSEESQIRFRIAEDNAVTLSVFDLNGKLVYETQNQFYKGENAFKISKNELPTTGVFIYKIATAHQALMKKLVLIRE